VHRLSGRRMMMRRDVRTHCAGRDADFAAKEFYRYRRLREQQSVGHCTGHVKSEMRVRFFSRLVVLPQRRAHSWLVGDDPEDLQPPLILLASLQARTRFPRVSQRWQPAVVC
jgi:hypothetical protein